MSRRDVTLIIALSLIWGASFMFIRVADRQFNPAALVFFRVGLGALVLVPVALARAGSRTVLLQVRANWLPIVLVGLINTAIPFLCFAWAETRIDSSLAAILQAAAPMFTVVIAVGVLHERVSGIRWLGFIAGFAGVALLVGTPGPGETLACLAVVLAALCYAVGSTISSRALSGTEPLVIAAGSTVVATLVVAPFGLTHLPAEVPGWKECASVAVLGIVGTGIAYMILFALIRSAGPSRTILVTYLIPGIAVLYGALLLNEPVTAVSLVGLALILMGVALAGRTRKVASNRDREKLAVTAAPALEGGDSQ
jgi:drug/metabolite transporter (DMT)-like permease